MTIKMNEARGQSFNAVHLNFYEFPSEDPSVLEIYCYTDQISYAPGDTVQFCTSTTARDYDIQVVRDGADRDLIYRSKSLRGTMHTTPRDAPVNGCKWPVAHTWKIPDDARSGGYLVITTGRNDGGETIEHVHFIVIRAATPGRDSEIVVICCTSTWIAYDDWGGASHYEGNVNGPDQNSMSPVLSTQRPWAKGQISLPIGAPRVPLEHSPEPGAIPRYPSAEWAYLWGYSKYYAAAGWASYERHFVRWAERNGYQLEFATQHDLHYRPEILEAYRCVVIVGHDEYWSAEMRDAMDAFVDSGGNVARFAANFIWQVRLENEGANQVCYKYEALARDPLRDSKAAKLTYSWDYAPIGRPGAQTFGLTGSYGIYTGFGGWNPRNAKGFTVYRPEHWAFEGTDLYYGDTFGSEARIFGFEVDGVDYTFRDGLPYATDYDRPPDTLEILAMGVSANAEEDHGNPGTVLFAGDADWRFLTHVRHREVTEESLAVTRYGAGMIAMFTRNGGTVFNAGSCEWVNGLRLREPITERITKNVLNRLANRRPKARPQCPL